MCFIYAQMVAAMSLTCIVLTSMTQDKQDAYVQVERSYKQQS